MNAPADSAAPVPLAPVPPAPVPAAPVEAPPPARTRPASAIVASALLIILAWGGLELWGLGGAPFHTKGEPREGLVVWEMTHGGGWILPKRNGEELPSKPPLFHWLGALTSLIRGSTDEWSIRFPSALLSLLGLLSVFAAGTALWSSRAGLVAALTLMTTFEWARAATNARVDMTLTFGLEVAFLSLLFFFRSRAPGWLVPLYIGITLAVLGKGPVGAALPGLVAVIMVALTRDISPLRQMRLGSGALAVSVGAGSWYVLALLLGGWAFFRKQVLAENVFTFIDNPEFGGGHRHGVLYLPGALLLGLLPWTLLLPGVAARLWRRRTAISLRDAHVYLLIWIAVVLGFYSVAASKRGVYLLSLYPAVALLIGWWWDDQRGADGDSQSWLARILALVTWPALGATGLVLVAVGLEAVGVPLGATAQRWLPSAAQPFTPIVDATLHAGAWPLLLCVTVAVAALYAALRAARRVSWRGIVAALFITIATLTVATQQIVMPGIARALTLRSFMTDVRQLVGPTADLSFYKTFDYGAVFYWHGHIPTYEGPWPAGAPRYVLMSQAEWEGARESAQGQYERVTFPGDGNENTSQSLVLVRRVGEQ
jgi:4-amino-4-deoxy-L-arabinose transferase-like glycosyltransferase